MPLGWHGQVWAQAISGLEPPQPPHFLNNHMGPACHVKGTWVNFHLGFSNLKKKNLKFSTQQWGCYPPCVETHSKMPPQPGCHTLWAGGTQAPSRPHSPKWPQVHSRVATRAAHLAGPGAIPKFGNYIFQIWQVQVQAQAQAQMCFPNLETCYHVVWINSRSTPGSINRSL